MHNNIRIVNAPKEIRSWAYQYLTLDNPDFYKRQRMGIWTGGTPREISLYERAGDDLILPFGCLTTIYNKLLPFKPSYKLHISPVRKINYRSGINLYPYQENAVRAAESVKNGIVVMPCGAGKTQTALEIVSRIGGRCLWLTHTYDLLNQSMNRAKSVYGLPSSCYGKITAGKVNVGSAITFATVQTMCKVDLSNYKDYWDIIIVDECQHCCGSPTRVTQFYKVVTQLSARYKIGLTATPARSDGLERSMFAILGDIIHETTREDVRHTTCDIAVDTIETGWMPDYDCVLMGDGTIDYSKLIDNMVDDEQRFQCVSNALNALDGSAIVLANRVRYIQRLSDEYNGRSVCLSTLGNSKRAKEIRKEALRKLECGELDMIFATYQLAKEGLDVPSLKYVVFATPEKDETTVIQSVGRVGRIADGKDHGTVIDFVDDFGMYKGWRKKRERYYKKIGAMY